MIEYDDDDNFLYSWRDGTDIDTSMINSNWCDNYPISSTINNHSNVFINGTCLQNTYDESLKLSIYICGPSMFVEEEWIFWISLCIMPLILCSLGLVYFGVMLKSLCKHLYCIDHNWVDNAPSRFEKITAIVMPIFGLIASVSGIILVSLIYFGYQTTGILLPSKYPPDEEYPVIYTFAYVFIWCGGLSLVSIPAICYTHVSSLTFRRHG